jgi:hypothetical protein
VACLVLGMPTTAFAQHINIFVGVKAGVPLNDQVNTEYSGFQAQTKPFTVGPVLMFAFHTDSASNSVRCTNVWLSRGNKPSRSAR